MIVSPTLIRRFITGSAPPLLVAAVQRLVAQLAVALARDLARVHHQIAGEELFADALSHVSCRVQLAARQDAWDCG
jgi:hypothetical protein